MKLNPVQEALLAHLKQPEFEPIVNECEAGAIATQALLSENETLKARIEYLEQQIATNAFGGWQIH